MKLVSYQRSIKSMMSHPAGVRGLKHTYRNGYYQNREVAPRRGAWVETKQMPNSDKLLKVAPRRGAWVETVL
mgnify:CR=1 FL=1